MDKNHKDPDVMDLSVPRRAQYVNKAWKRHQDAVYWVDINLAIRKGLSFYQTRSNAITLQETLPACCIPKAVRMETGQVRYEKVYMSPRPPPKISLKHEWNRELGSERAQRSEVGQLSRSFQSNQPLLSPSRERTVRPVGEDDTRTAQDGRKTSRSQEIDASSFHEEAVSSDRTEQPSKRSKATAICHWKRYNRIGIVCRIKIIRESGEWSSAKKTETNFKCYRRWRETFYDLGNVQDCNNGISGIHGKELPEQLSIHCEHNRSHTQTTFDISTRLVSEQDDISGLETTGWENHSWKYLSLIGDERVINLQRTKVYVFSDYVLCLGKILENHPIERCMGTKIGMVKPFSKIQKLWRNRRRANGIRVGYFPRIQYVAAQSRSSRVTVEIRWDSRNFHRKNHIYVDVQRHLMGIKRQWTRMPGEWQTRFSVRKKIWKRTMVIYWSWFWKEVVLYQWRQSTRNLGPYRGKDAGGIRRKWLSNFPCYEPIVVQRSTQKQRTWKTVDTLSSRIGNDWDYFSHNCLCKISSVFTEQSRRYVKSMKPFMKEWGDPLWWGNQVPHPCKVWSRQKYLWIVMTRPTKIFYCGKMENELNSCHNKTNWANFVWTQDFWMLLKLDTTSGRKTLQISNNIMQWPVVNTLFQEKKKHHNQKDWSKGTPRLGPC